MAEPKTKASDASIDVYLASRASDAQLANAHALMTMLARMTGEQPTMWVPSIVGYGECSNRYECGRIGPPCLAGFAIRGKEFVVYLSGVSQEQAWLLVRLGKYKKQNGQSLSLPSGDLYGTPFNLLNLMWHTLK